MNATKKTLTVLTTAAAMALGGIAIAQTSSDTSGAGASLGSSSTMQNSGNSTMGSSDLSTDQSTMSNTTTPSSSDTTTLGAGPSTDTPSLDTSAPQMDRN